MPDARALRLGRQHKFTVFELENAAANHARRARPRRNGQRQHNRQRPRARQQHDQRDVNQRRNAGAHVDEPGDDHIHPSAEIAGDAADHHAHHRGDDRAQQADDQRNARAHPDAGPEIAARLIRAEPVGGARLQIALHQVGLFIPVGHHHRPNHGHHRNQQNHSRADHGHPVARHPAQHAAPVALAGANGAVRRFPVVGQADKILLGHIRLHNFALLT